MSIPQIDRKLYLPHYVDQAIDMDSSVFRSSLQPVSTDAFPLARAALRPSTGIAICWKI